MRGELARLETAAQRYMRSKWWARAVETYEELVRLAPHETGYRVSLAGAYLKMNRKLDAVRIYTSLLVPESREPTSRLMEYQREILAIDPANTESYILFGDILVGRKLFQDAKSQYLLAVRQFEKRSTFGKAADTLRRIEELDPKNPYIKIHLANIHYKKGDTRDAVSCLGAAAGLLKESGSTEDARMVLGEILALDPKNRDAAGELARLGGDAARVEEPAEAAEREEQYAEEPRDRESFFRRANEALAAGDAAKAAGSLERASSLYPGDPRVKIRLGEVYEKRRMIEDAVQARRWQSCGRGARPVTRGSSSSGSWRSTRATPTRRWPWQR
jgi:tetratricopeptide (TPR) repeat protein